MLGLFSLCLGMLFIPAGHFNWYHKMWSLTLGSGLGLMAIFSPFWGYEYSFYMVVQDSSSLVLICLTFWISMLMLTASQKSVKMMNNNSYNFTNVVIILNLILVGSFMCSSSISFYFLFECSLIPTVLLILGWGYQPERLQSGMYMMIYTVGASLPLLLMVLWSFLDFGSGEMLMINSLRFDLSFMGSSMLNYLTFVIFMAFLVKLPMFGVHLWLPKAHVEAPVSGSMVLAAILLKLGGYGIIRFFSFFNFYISGSLFFLLSLCLWGGMISSIICFRQTDLKSLIAYSSVGHMSIMVAGIFSNTSWGWGCAVILMVAHGFCSSCLFCLANYTYEKVQSRSLVLNKGMLALMPSLSFWWFMLCIMNMAAPPSLNLVGEAMAFACIGFSSFLLLIPLGLMSFISALYSLYLFTCVNHGSSINFTSSFTSISSGAFCVMVAHWAPGNLLLLKSSIMLMS